jgi:hypothetical protein
MAVYPITPQSVSNYLTDCIDRLAAIYDLVLNVPTTSIDVPVFKYFPVVPPPEVRPYLTLRLGADTILETNQDTRYDTFAIIARLVLGHLTENVDGQNIMQQYAIVPAVKNMFQASVELRNVAAGYSTVANGLVDINPYAPISSGLRLFVDAGIDANEIGIEFTHTFTFMRF